MPTGLLDAQTVRKVKRTLKFSEVSTDRVSSILKSYEPEDGQEDLDYSEFQFSAIGETVTVNEYRECRGGVSLPRAFARKLLPDVDWRDATVNPSHDIPFTGTIEPRDEQQSKFFDALMQAALPDGPQDILANATTGSGKTVAGIYLGWQLSTPTLIVVDSNKIANGWLKNFRQFFGQGWTERNVGRVQQDECKYKSKAFVITMAQSLASRKNRYPADFYRHFGLVVVDEVQVFGGPHFSPILYMFPARVRVHLTAENRSGAFGRLIIAHTGDTRIVSKQEVLKPNAWVLENTLTETFWCQSDGALLSGLSKVRSRNERLASLIHVRGYERGRNVLILSNRTAQLLQIRNMCRDLGIPDDTMGIHAGTYQTDRYVVYYTLPDSTKRNRLAVVETYNEGRTLISRIKREDYDGIRMPAALYNRLQAGEKIGFSQQRENFSPTQTDLDNITHSCQIIFATYEIFSKGVDVPKLDMGVEALPSGNVKQPLGRVLRLAPNKPVPEWYSIHDVLSAEILEDTNRVAEAVILSEFFNGKTKARKLALRKAGAKVSYQR